mgnify:CR=1 FL=1
MLKTVADIAGVLEARGYEIQVDASNIITKLGAQANPYTAVLHLGGDKLNITCELAKLGEFSEENLSLLAFQALSANTVVDPYAFAIIDSSDDPEIENAEDFTLVLIDTIPTTDLSEEELVFAMDKLWDALTESVDVLKVGFGKVAV